MDQTYKNPAVRRRPPRLIVFEEYAARDGVNTTNGLKLIAVICMIGGIAGAIQGIDAKNIEFALSSFLTGLLSCALLFAVTLVIENLVAIRKNTAHLAGLRATIVAQAEQQESPINSVDTTGL